MLTQTTIIITITITTTITIMAVFLTSQAESDRPPVASKYNYLGLNFSSKK